MKKKITIEWDETTGVSFNISEITKTYEILGVLEMCKCIIYEQRIPANKTENTPQ